MMRNIGGGLKQHLLRSLNIFYVMFQIQHL